MLLMDTRYVQLLESYSTIYLVERYARDFMHMQIYIPLKLCGEASGELKRCKDS